MASQMAYEGNNARNGSEEQRALFLSNNERGRQQQQQQQEERQFYPCQYCNRKFPTYNALGGHQNGHRGQRQADRLALEVAERLISMPPNLLRHAPPPPPQTVYPEPRTVGLLSCFCRHHSQAPTPGRYHPYHNPVPSRYPVGLTGAARPEPRYNDGFYSSLLHPPLSAPAVPHLPRTGEHFTVRNPRNIPILHLPSRVSGGGGGEENGLTVAKNDRNNGEDKLDLDLHL